MKVRVEHDGETENIAVVIGNERITCKDYETDYWVKKIVEALGGEYEEVEVELDPYEDMVMR